MDAIPYVAQNLIGSTSPQINVENGVQHKMQRFYSSQVPGFLTPPLAGTHVEIKYDLSSFTGFYCSAETNKLHT